MRGCDQFVGNDVVTFEMSGLALEKNPNICLPDRRLLAIHAVCARVANMSGAADVIEEWDRGLDETDVLAEDGSSASIITRQLSNLAFLQEMGSAPAVAIVT